MKKLFTIMLIFTALTIYADTKNIKKITLQDTIAETLKNNLDLKIEVINAQSSEQTLFERESIFIPSLGMNFQNRETNSPATGAFDGADINKRETLSFLVDLEKKFSLGGTFKVELSNDRTKTNSSYSTVNPDLTSRLTLSLNQPLLKNFGTFATKKDIYIAANNLKKSKIQLKSKIIDLIYDTEKAYWNLVYAYQNLEAKQKSLEQSKNFLKQNTRKVEIGTSAPIDILTAKAEVATKESEIITAEQQIQIQEEILKMIISSKNKDISIIPLDKPEIKPFSANFNDYLLEALNNRPDIEMAKIDLKNQKITVKYSKNQLLPELSLQASYFTNGKGGTQMIYAPNTSPFAPREPIGSIEKSVWDAIQESFENKYLNYSISLNLKIPLSLKKEKAQLARARLDFKKSFLTLKKLENNTYSLVNNGIKSIQTNKKLYDKNEIALKLQGQKLRAEKMKLSVGLSTNYQVLVFQRDFANSEAAKLQSAINYELTIADMNKILGKTLKIYNIKFKEFKIGK